MGPCDCNCHNNPVSDRAAFGSDSTMLSKLDQDIKKISLDLRNLKERRNALVPAFRLPPEIVTRIFRILTARTSFVEMGKSLSFSQVCQFWRKLALGYSALWTTLPCEHPKLALEMIERSRNLPVAIVTTLHRTLKYGPLRHLLGSVSIDNLRLSIQPMDLDFLHQRIRNLSATIQHIQLIRQDPEETSDSESEDSDEDIDEDAAIEAILNDVAPSLLSLELEIFSMPPTIMDFPRLTTLVLRCGPFLLKSHEILAVLRRTPLLEYINLDKVDLNQEQLASKDLTEVTLPRLQDFLMTNETTPRSITFVLQHIRFPSDTRIQLTLLNCFKDKAAPFLRAVALACQSLEEDAIQYFSVTAAEGHLFFTGWTTMAGGAPRKSLQIACEIWNSDLVHREVIACLPLNSVHSLWISGEHCAGMAAYLTLPRLQRVGLHGPCAWIIGQPTQNIPETGGSSASKMDVLALGPVNFNSRTPMDLVDGATYLTQQEVTLPSLLVSFVQRGRDRGAPLRTLILDSCKNVPKGLGDLFAAVKGQAMIEIGMRSNELDEGGLRTHYGKKPTFSERERYYWFHLRDGEDVDIMIDEVYM